MKKLLLVSTFESFDAKLDEVFGSELSGMNVVCIPTAAYGEENHEWLGAEMAPVRKRAGQFTELDIASKPHEEVDSVLNEADIIYVTGGNTYYLLEHAQACSLKKYVEQCFERGGLYLGSSAGAIIACPRMGFIGALDDSSRGNPKGFEAMGFVDFLIMPHLDHPAYGPQIQDILSDLKSEGEQVLGLCDDQGLYVEDNYMKVY